MIDIVDRKFVCYFFFSGWSDISLGLSISIIQSNIEIHVPFGFFKIGLVGDAVYREDRKVCIYGIGAKT